MAFDRPKKKPKQTLRAGKRKLILRRALLCLIPIGILLLHFLPGFRSALSSVLPFIEPPHRVLDTTGCLAVHFISVGQGDATLIVTPEGEALLVDAGPPESASELVEYLKASGVASLSCLILTHPHPDHIGGALTVLRSFPVNAVLTNGEAGVIGATSTPETDAADSDVSFAGILQKYLVSVGLSAEIPACGSEYRFGSVTMTCLGPAARQQPENDMSLIFRLSYGNHTFLLTGDAEAAEETELLSRYSPDELRADVLKVGHHGSSTSSTDAFLDAVKPSIAVFSCGKNNSYGHPHTEVLAAFAARGAEILRTDLDGTVVLISDGETIRRIDPFTLRLSEHEIKLHFFMKGNRLCPSSA